MLRALFGHESRLAWMTACGERGLRNCREGKGTVAVFLSALSDEDGMCQTISPVA